MSRLIPEVASCTFLAIVLSVSGASAEQWGTNSGQHALPTCPKGKGVAWHNCQGSVMLADGVEYIGDFKHDKPDGFGMFDDHDRKDQGLYTWRAAGAHLGSLDGAAPRGQVDISLLDGAEYAGEFQNGLPNGKGTLITARGDKYIGNFVAGMPNGQGADIRRNRERYVGEWRSGKRSGHGTLTYANGDEYVGEFAGDAPTGHGVTTNPNQQYYADASDADEQDRSNKAKASNRSSNNAKSLPLVPQIELARDMPPSTAAQNDPPKSPGKSKLPGLILMAMALIAGGAFIAFKNFKTA